MGIKNLGKLLLSIIIVQVFGLIGSVATFPAINTWYKTLERPSFSPPNWIFGPVWTVLYILMGAALYLIWDKGLKKKNVRVAFWFFIAHLGVNAGWSVVFFGLHSPLGGLLVIFFLLACIIALIRLFYPIDRSAAYLLVPYLLWVSFATVLNFSFLLLNP